MKGPRAFGISLWLVPHGDARRLLAARIASLAERLGTPPFEPHVTLLGGIAGEPARILGAARALAAQLLPLSIRLIRLDDSDEYFRCLFLDAAPDAALLEARRRASASLGRIEQAFRPHLSLAYGELSPAERQRIRHDAADGLPGSFHARTLEAVRTEGPPSAWRSLIRLPLGRASRLPRARSGRTGRGGGNRA